MHWIGVGIMIWIGLAVAPILIATGLVLLPFAFFIPVCAILGFQLTGGSGGAWIGAAIGAFIAMKIWHSFDD